MWLVEPLSLRPLPEPEPLGLGLSDELPFSELDMSKLYVSKGGGSTPGSYREKAHPPIAACSRFAGNLKLTMVSENPPTSRSAGRAAFAMDTIAVLGSTGSIGTNCLDVIGALPERLNLQGVAARTSWQLLGQQTERFTPRWAVLSDASLRDTVPRSAFSSRTELLFGPEAIERLAADP